MNLRPFRILAAVLCAALLTLSVPVPARGSHFAQVLIDGVPFSQSAYIENGVSYLPLAAFARETLDAQVSWDGTAAHITAQSLSLRAQPDQLWVEANGRCFYVPGGVRLAEGRTLLPTRTLAQIFGLSVDWNAQQQTVLLSGTAAAPEGADSYYDPEILYWLSRVISAESRGEPLEGQIAVGNVALNRVASNRFPNSLYEVIFQPGQFEPVENGTIFDEPYHLSVTAAKLCLEGANTVGDCLFFFAPALSPGTWIVDNCTYYTTIGCHRFYL